MRADRLLSLLMLLQLKGQCTAQELARRLEVSERTIYRDIEALSTAGVPVYAERGPGGGCMLAEGYRTNLTGLNESEVRTLFMSGITSPLADLGVSDALEAALRKLLAALPSAHRHDAERARQRLYMDSAWWYEEHETAPFLQTLQIAIWQDRKVRMTYRKRDGEVSERVVDPLGLVAKADTWYMVAISNGELRVFRVSRVRKVEILDEPCQRPENFDLEEYWTSWISEFQEQTQGVPYSVTIRVSREALPIVPQVLGESVYDVIERADPPDAEGRITLNLTFGSSYSARNYMLHFGPQVEILEPEELRAAVVSVAAGIVEFYKDKVPERESERLVHFPD